MIRLVYIPYSMEKINLERSRNAMGQVASSL